MSERKGKVQTVLGLIEPSELGYTQPHEHLFVNLLPPPYKDLAGEEITLQNYGRNRLHSLGNAENLRLTSQKDAANEMRLYKEAGGNSIVDLTVIGLDRDPRALAEISRESGVAVVMGCGYYQSEYHPPEVETMSEEDLAGAMIRDIAEGADGTGIRAGIVGEIGLTYPMHKNERRVLRAAAMAQVQTGASLNIHPGRDSRSPVEALDVVKEAGGDIGRVVISHIDRTLFAADDMVRLAESGCYLEFDLFGQESSYYPPAPIDMPNDAIRIDYLMMLIARGFGEKLLVSQDICQKIHITRYGGDGYAHILQTVLPVMKRKGMDDREIEAVTVGNPARMLTFIV
jgi:phosphotriesterase-related protein